MQLSIDTSRNVQSAFIHAIRQRALKLTDQAKQIDILQALSSQWRNVNVSLHVVLDELDRIQNAIEPPTDTTITECIRRMIYDAVEVMDVYSTFFPKALAEAGLAVKGPLADYKRIAKRLRDRWAYICNACKHAGSQIICLSVTRPADNQRSFRFLFLKYQNGNSLLRDDVFHEKREGGICFIKLTFELLHSLFKLDLEASQLVRSCVERKSDGSESEGNGLVSSDVLRRLDQLHSWSMNDSTRHSAFAVQADNVRLCIRQIPRLSGELRSSLSLTGDGVTREYSVK